jgi:opacity protein-like surface antigen
MYSISAFAADPGFYAGVNGGLTIPVDSSYRSGGWTFDVTNNTGYAAGVVGGYAFENNIRVEVELGYKSFETDMMSVSGFGEIGRYSSTVSSFNELINVYYDIRTPYTSGITPYIGAGLGDAFLMTSDGTLIGGRAVSSSGTIVIAYQAAAGAAYDVTPNVTLDLGYRYFGTSDAWFKSDTSVNGVKLGDFKASYASHNVIAGLRYKF